jgi:hypothetical protein
MQLRDSKATNLKELHRKYQAAGPEDGRQQAHEEADGIHAQEAGGCHQQTWEPHQVLAVQYTQ